MSVGRSLAVFRHNVRLLLGDPGPVFLFVVTPLLLMAIIKPASEALLHNEGFPDATGAEQVVPAFTVMFAFFWMGYIGRNFFAEHGWGTWERLQTTVASPVEIMVGKLLPGFVLILFQQIVLFVGGSLIFGLDSKGPAWALVLVDIPLILVVLTLTLALVALTRTLAQMDAISQGLTMAFATLGGSLVPVAALPQWAQDIGPAVPSYHALEAARKVILEGDGVGAVLPYAGFLLAFAALFTFVAVLRFSFGEAKSVEV
jgi:ABC-2 type transport system permease protein